MMGSAAIVGALNEQLSLNNASRVLVVGLGETGFSVAKFLHQYDIPFAVVDSREKPPLKEALLKQYPDTPLFTGGFDKAAFDVATHLLVSPGVSLQEESIKKAILAGVKIVSDIDLFACSTDKAIVAITGSNGKSTVTTMLGVMGSQSGVKTAIGGNLGVPALDLLDQTIELYVLELSSFQLERTSVLNATVATVLNVSEDHLDRHMDFKVYAQEKQKVFNGDGVMILNEDDAFVKAMVLENRTVKYFSTQKKSDFYLESRQGESWLMNAEQALMRQDDLPVEGLHNIANVLAALALGKVAGLSVESMTEALKTFKGLDHRMQKVACVNGVSWVNDSKATNIGACVAALQGYRHKVVLIAGGDAKGANMSQLVPAIKDKAKCVVLIGKDAALIENAMEGCVPAYRVETVKDAVNLAAELAEQGESVLLSPACASFDQFKNYQERGDKFTAAVMDLAA